jgi:DNA repair protein RadC
MLLKPTIKQWANDDRPREKLLTKGVKALSNTELLAILIATGSIEKSAVDLAKDILQMVNNNLVRFTSLSVKQLQQIKGIGPAKAVTIAAAIELGSRIQISNFDNLKSIHGTQDIATLLQHTYGHFAREVFAVVYLNNAHKMLAHEVVSEGGLQGTMVDSRIIFKNALLHNATSIIACHNHPSGNLQPSRSDVELTHKIIQAGNIMQVGLIDHIIVSKAGYYSFAEHNLLLNI